MKRELARERKIRARRARRQREHRSIARFTQAKKRVIHEERKKETKKSDQKRKNERDKRSVAQLSQDDVDFAHAASKQRFIRTEAGEVEEEKKESSADRLLRLGGRIRAEQAAAKLFHERETETGGAVHFEEKEQGLEPAETSPCDEEECEGEERPSAEEITRALEEIPGWKQYAKELWAGKFRDLLREAPSAIFRLIIDLLKRLREIDVVLIETVARLLTFLHALFYTVGTDAMHSVAYLYAGTWGAGISVASQWAFDALDVLIEKIAKEKRAARIVRESKRMYPKGSKTEEEARRQLRAACKSLGERWDDQEWVMTLNTEALDLSALESAGSFFTDLWSSSLATSVRDAVVSLASLRFFDRDVAMKVTRHLGPVKRMGTFELVQTVWSAFLSLLRAGKSIMEGMSISDVLFADDPYQALRKELLLLLAMEERLYFGLPVPDCMDVVEFITRARVAIDQGDGLVTKARTMNPILVEILSLTNRLKDLRRGIVAQAEAGTRIAPFVIVMPGEPGIGKSRFVNYWCQVWSEVKGRRFKDSHVYSKVNTSEYCEGYDPLSQPIWHFTELGASAKSIMQAKGDPTLALFTALVDSNKLSLNMPGVHEKGKVFARPEFCDC